MMIKRSYDVVANVYDSLAKIFIGNSLRESQKYFLKKIPANASVLIAGGGTGWILEEITRVHPQGLCIDYVDISAKMITKARNRFTGNNEVHFVQQSILDFANNTKYDVIITPFFLDNFNEATLQKVFTLLDQKLKPEALWIHTDFQENNKIIYWQKALLFIMYSFFRIACNIEATWLPDIAICFKNKNYLLIESNPFLHRFIITSLYKKV